MRGLFVTGTDTGVGKTVTSAALLAAAAPDVRYWKPVQSGVEDEPGDRETVATLAGVALASRTAPEVVRLRAPASPHHAAALEGRAVRVSDVLGAAASLEGRFIVEGAGGLLVPLGDAETLRDLVRALGLPALVVASTRLGTINHTLLTLEALERAGLPTVGVVLVGPSEPGAESGLAAHAPGRVLGRLPSLDLGDPAALRAAGRALLAGAPALAQVLG
jgi:malonyl-CoA O-methyltransferase